MNSVEINSARQELLNQCTNMTNQTLDLGLIKEVEIDDKIVVLSIGPTIVNLAKIAILDKGNRTGNYMPLKKRKVGYSAKVVTEKVINEFFKDLEEKTIKGEFL